MNQANPQRSLNSVLALAGLIGGYIAAFALLTVLGGLWLDQALNSGKHIATLVCVIGGLPVNLLSALWLTQRLIARIVPPDQVKARSGEAKDRPSDDSPDSPSA
jgi:biotin transporter BioY